MLTLEPERFIKKNVLKADHSRNTLIISIYSIFREKLTPSTGLKRITVN